MSLISIPMRTCIAVLVACVRLSAVPAEAQESAAAFRAVIEFHGFEKLASYTPVDIPFCPTRATRPECERHSTAAITAVHQALREQTLQPGRAFALSPVRDSAGATFVDMYVTVDPVEPGLGGGELYRFTLSRDGSRVLSERRLLSELFVSRKR